MTTNLESLAIEVGTTPKLWLAGWSICQQAYAVISPAKLVIYGGDAVYPGNEPVIVVEWKFLVLNVERSTTRNLRNIRRYGIITKDGDGYVDMDITDKLTVPLSTFRKIPLPLGFFTEAVLKTEFRKLVKRMFTTKKG